MNNFEVSSSFDQYEPEAKIICKQIQPSKYSLEELERITTCQINAGREICLIKARGNLLKTIVLDLRGITDFPEDQETKYKNRLINEITGSLLVLIVED